MLNQLNLSTTERTNSTPPCLFTNFLTYLCLNLGLDLNPSAPIWVFNWNSSEGVNTFNMDTSQACVGPLLVIWVRSMFPRFRAHFSPTSSSTTNKRVYSTKFGGIDFSLNCSPWWDVCVSFLLPQTVAQRTTCTWVSPTYLLYINSRWSGDGRKFHIGSSLELLHDWY